MYVGNKDAFLNLYFIFLLFFLYELPNNKNSSYFSTLINRVVGSMFDLVSMSLG